MGRGRGFSPMEDKIILENYDKTITEIERIFRENGYERSRKSINRKIEKFREEGLIGFRSESTVKRSYKQRSRTPRPSRLDENSLSQKDLGFDSGEPGFDSGDGGFNDGDADFDSGVDWD